MADMPIITGLSAAASALAARGKCGASGAMLKRLVRMAAQSFFPIFMVDSSSESCFIQHFLDEATNFSLSQII